MSNFEAGRQTGLSADQPFEEAYSLSTYYDDYKVGYVIGCAEVASVRAAYSEGFAITAGQLAARYHIAPQHFDAHVKKEDHSIFVEEYNSTRNEMAEAFAEEEGEE
ncbi:DUF2623 family protein [Pseudomonas sp. ANT_H14]|uniref:DUF2623 family protein n=1 Tax=unclassified Pseudomonas TaxID=196821 RepID=UPI0011EC4917|nr:MULTISPECIES: DUF2623 family protein [unclassified Pseudomonas]KAA0948938.1 DUF2623 family protein [Pseudomonas sp. ANT_H4]KAA0954284.1 DUF2623 family protein [Pseudomonas sp. ANT_H14]